MNDFRILLHHHAIAYQSASKKIYMPSFIGRWVNALSNHFSHIGLLFYVSETLRPEQDEIIEADNVDLYSLGPPGKTWDRISRIKKLRRVCARASEQADGLLIRGVTPRQSDVWRFTFVENKAFLLVGSLLQTKPKLTLSFWGIYDALMVNWRKIEVLQISRQGVLMANSPALVGELEQMNRRAVFVPTSSIRFQELQPLNFKELSNPRKILFCGRVVAEKGIFELLRAVSQLSKDTPCELDIVGPVEEIFYQSCDSLIQKLGIVSLVKWHGYIPYGDRLFDFYHHADVCVLPSYYEGFPHIIWEAAANCCPVVATRVGGIPALWKDLEHGLLIAPKDISALVQALKKLFNNDALRSRLIMNAHAYVSKFTVESCANQLVNALDEGGWRKNAK